MRIDMLLPFIGGFAVARVAHRKERKYGLINRQGVFIVHPIYDMVDYSGGEFVCVNKGYKEERTQVHNGRWGVVDTRYKEILPLKYSHMESWGDGEHFTVCYRNRWGVINSKGESTMSFMLLDYLGVPNCKGLLYASVSGKYGYLDKSGRQVIKVIYDELSPIYSESPDDWLAVRLADESFYIDQNGKRVLF